MHVMPKSMPITFSAFQELESMVKISQLSLRFGWGFKQRVRKATSCQSTKYFTTVIYFTLQQYFTLLYFTLFYVTGPALER